tara:strand:+ start:575 stop:982 length:408 start_codon:yes stop_codon:yes gene_type:complete
MADAVATQTLFDGERMAIMKFTNISDGTGETKVVKVDVSTLTSNAFGKACDGVTITKIHALTHGMEVDMYWDATTDVLIGVIPQNRMYSMDLTQFGGLWNNAGAGKTGDVLFSTRDTSIGDTYTIVLEMVKSYAE